MKTDIFKYFLLTSICFSSCVSARAMSLEEYIAQENPQDAPYIAQAIYDTSNMYGVDPLVMASIFYVESRYHNNAVSPAGALGIAQLMPGTASDLGVNPYDIYQNIEGGTRYFKELLDSQNPSDPYRYNLALSSYNAGPGNVNGYSPTYTYDYIRTVTDVYNDIVQHVDPTTPVKSTQIQEYTPSSDSQVWTYHKKSKKERLAKAIHKLKDEKKHGRARERY